MALTSLDPYGPMPGGGDDIRGNGGNEHDQPLDDSTTFDLIDSLDGDYNDVVDPFVHHGTREELWDWTGTNKDMCEVGFWKPEDPVNDPHGSGVFSCNEEAYGSFGLSSSNVRNGFEFPETSMMFCGTSVKAPLMWPVCKMQPTGFSGQC